MRGIYAACLAVIFASSLLAQRNTQLTGRVTDASDAVVPQAAITVVNQDTGLRRETSTNELGYYMAPLLQPGRYNITVKKDGFRPVTQSEITLTVDQSLRVDIVLEIGRVTETVEVTANVTAVDTQSATLREVVDEQIGRASCRERVYI